MNKEKRIQIKKDNSLMAVWSEPELGLRSTADKGVMSRRIKFNDRELSFAAEWDKENDKSWNCGTNHYHGILQDLFIEQTTKFPFSHKWFVKLISKRERMIVATVIQWLGSNVGMCFLGKALSRCGYKIVKVK